MIYLDNAATTAVCPQAAQAALRAMTEDFGNPSSLYPLGKAAASLRESGRGVIAAALGCESGELFFTSCGTESDNWAIRGAVELGRRKGRHIVTSAIEHAAVLEPMKALEREGFEVTYLRPDRQGHIAPGAIREALRPDTILVSLMLVNNELGTLLPVAEAAAAIREAGCPALLHTDAVQAFLKVPFTPKELGADLLSISGHKVHAPKGIGALYIRKGLKFPPLLLGGGQENSLRPGTEATAQIAAFAAAVETWTPERNEALRALRDYAGEVLGRLDGVEILSAGDAPHILAIALPGYPSEMLVRELGDAGFCVSSGSACHRGKPSHVFAALGLPKRTVMGALRLSFSEDNTRSDIDVLAQALRDILRTRIAAR